ncbi:ArsR/SmtB family transcription factor [Alkalicoccus halolimnae]|uniref:Metalloregulator ArsR/SmtB family transcription factor n=1 Tax=Alkalicoccus halolimnae TaxID=1667239 RepID=A0A5C7F4Q9_9BACI|nr:metalloregulator ArsR/SmtB family transcription factor [Alkalicoccus halolimnae]TXF83261.1 winged helix-turn-helix transcriptional regulator [Alkalicoccus halolimnae]
MSAKDQCEIFTFDKQKVASLKEKILTEDVEVMAGMFKALADKTRMHIAYALSLEEELCVCDAAQITDTSTATASHHLRTLKKLGLAKFRKQGKLAFYSLDDDHIRQMIQMACEHSRE